MQTFVVSAIFMLLLGFMFHKYTSEVERRVVAEVASRTSELALQYKDDTARMSQELADMAASHSVEIAQARTAYTEEINAMRSTYEQNLRDQPFNTGNFYERRLANIMCQISSTNADDLKACDLQASSAYAPDKSIVVTVTADTAEQWKEQCEDGYADYCDYAIVGFTSQGALTFMDYFNQVKSYIQELKNAGEYDEKVIDALLNGIESSNTVSN